jgi:hypothetical protein
LPQSKSKSRIKRKRMTDSNQENDRLQ